MAHTYYLVQGIIINNNIMRSLGILVLKVCEEITMYHLPYYSKSIDGFDSVLL